MFYGYVFRITVTYGGYGDPALDHKELVSYLIVANGIKEAIRGLEWDNSHNAMRVVSAENLGPLVHDYRGYGPAEELPQPEPPSLARTVPI